jgi:hypothetical protein
VRRAKLYYLRDLRGKAAKIREKRDGVEGYGDGILSTPEPVAVVAPVVAAVVVEAPVAEAVAEAPAVEAVVVSEPETIEAVAEVPASDATTDVVVEAESAEAPKAE